MDKPPSYVITYRPPRGSDGWQVGIRLVNRTIDTWTVGTCLEAIRWEVVKSALLSTRSTPKWLAGQDTQTLPSRDLNATDLYLNKSEYLLI
ncbi:hypothetical protein PLANPX_3250 [Lacipirellula parvula]|uniref:Uncharacterized protein n=1 Tax=Lacipirellula parvula TaxID=2650471 RepID=A0A5K7XAS1_9BACT|nr:hypothetical protein PLANPX_3250 [Lacipirellula parvula]